MTPPIQRTHIQDLHDDTAYPLLGAKEFGSVASNARF